MKIYFIRHGKTKGNIERRYVGTTDEGLVEGKQEALVKLKTNLLTELLTVEEIYVSPLRRCVETGSFLFPEARQILVDGFRECDFGDFEYKNHNELIDNPVYQQWLHAGGEITFPGGESKESFQSRVVESFLSLMREDGFYSSLSTNEAISQGSGNRKIGNEEKTIFMVVHGGTIMSILDRFSVPHKDYFDWQVGNGEGFVGDVIVDDGEVTITNLHSLCG